MESRQREVLMGKQEVKVVFESGWSQPKEPRRLRSHKTSIPAATVNRKLQSAEIEGSDISSGDSSLGAAASGSDVYALSETEDSEDS